MCIINHCLLFWEGRYHTSKWLWFSYRNKTWTALSFKSPTQALYSSHMHCNPLICSILNRMANTNATPGNDNICELHLTSFRVYSHSVNLYLLFLSLLPNRWRIFHGILFTPRWRRFKDDWKWENKMMMIAFRPLPFPAHTIPREVSRITVLSMIDFSTSTYRWYQVSLG